MLATLLIIRQFLQNVKEVLQPYLYERHKLGELTVRAVWDLLLSVLLKYARLAAGKAQASPTDQTMPGPGLRGSRLGAGPTGLRSQYLKSKSACCYREGGTLHGAQPTQIIRARSVSHHKHNRLRSVRTPL